LSEIKIVPHAVNGVSLEIYEWQGDEKGYVMVGELQLHVMDNCLRIMSGHREGNSTEAKVAKFNAHDITGYCRVLDDSLLSFKAANIDIVFERENP
jgi:hypothetical protein